MTTLNLKRFSLIDKFQNNYISSKFEQKFYHYFFTWISQLREVGKYLVIERWSPNMVKAFQASIRFWIHLGDYESF